MAKPKDRKRAKKEQMSGKTMIIDEEEEKIKETMIETKRKINEWLVDEGLFRQKLSDPNSHFNFRIDFPRDKGVKMHVAQQLDMNDSVAIIWSIGISPQHKTELNKMKEKDRLKFFVDIRNTLLLLSSFQFIPDLKNPESLQLSRIIYYDGLSKDRLFKEISNIYRAGLYFIWTISEKFGSISGDSGLKNLYQ